MNDAGGLRVTSSPIDDPGSLIARLSPSDPLAFIRNGDGIIGIGAALRLSFTGPSRIADAAAAWRALVAASTVSDAVRLPGSGLVAFGSFAFSDESAATSVLIVPSVIVGRRDGVAWVTRVCALRAAALNTAGGEEGGSSSAERMAPGHILPDEAPAGPAFGVSLTPGRTSPKAYAAAVSAAIEHIVAGEVRKVVLARELAGELPAGADLRHPLGRLAAAYPDTFTFAVAGLVGASPETLVRVDGITVTARVLAGTAPRDEPQEAIANSPKDLAEHSYARESVMTALERHATGVTAAPPYPLALPNLWHLASDVTGTLTDGSSSLDLVAALHPTAAVAGAPTDVALRLIAELETFDRGRYAGPVGWVGANGDGEWAVALRCAQVDGALVTAYAGAGIVADSDPARELAETTLKFRPVAEAFG